MLVGNYNLVLVSCSLLVAILASHTALSMAEQMHVTQYKKGWHVCGSVAMGVGIWSMHFIGMLAFSLPIELGYDLGLTFVSLVIAIIVSYFALWQVSVQQVNKRRVALSAILMGLGISTMHYTGMEAMQMFPAIEYKKSLLILSVLIAIGASYAALHIILWMRLRTKAFYLTKAVAATLMGIAIVGMHYTGMMAAQFPANSICGAAGLGVQTEVLAVLVGLGSLMLFFVSKLASVFDARATFFMQSLDAANQQLKTQALYDQLTKLPNRVLLEERVKQALHQANHHKHLVTYMAINLDGFKSINDSMGPTVGDAFLKEIAHRIRSIVEKQYTVARTAGDEFVVVLEQVAPEDAAVLAEEIIMVVKAPVVIDGRELVTSASVGIAVSFVNGETYEDISFHADVALQHKKQSGKNGYRYYEDAMNVDAARNLELILQLRHAIELNQLSLHYQPKFDVKKGCVHSAEALLRWEHPKHGFISPTKFIQLAEESGLIASISDWVLEQACRQIQEWRALGYEDMNVAVNLSSVQFLQENLYQSIVRSLAHWGVPAKCLTLEITESTAMQNVERSLIVLQEIADLGVKVSIDDFGTGYSSLLYLKRFPASELKIDRAFVSLVCTSSEDELLVSAIISLGHQFGLKVVAEGVETSEQKDLLSSLECDTLQGFYLGKPKPAIEFFFDNKAYMKKTSVKNPPQVNYGLNLSFDK
jgi:diguanylate cyclase